MKNNHETDLTARLRAWLLHHPLITVNALVKQVNQAHPGPPHLHQSQLSRFKAGGPLPEERARQVAGILEGYGFEFETN